MATIEPDENCNERGCITELFGHCGICGEPFCEEHLEFCDNLVLCQSCNSDDSNDSDYEFEDEALEEENDYNLEEGTIAAGPVQEHIQSTHASTTGNSIKFELDINVITITVLFRGILPFWIHCLLVILRQGSCFVNTASLLGPAKTVM
jgi:hypothetical protein